ncbi:MAG: ribosome small subunit-dependent GTPase A [Desulfuromonadales bacterium]
MNKQVPGYLQTLQELGWSLFFQEQLSPEECESMVPCRVFALNRHLVDGVGTEGRLQFALPQAWRHLPVMNLPTIGDWLLLDDLGQPRRLLQRKSVFRRMASGRDAKLQLMGANVDTLFIVSSCNQDFNLSRLERYLALALDAEVDPVVILTKADLVTDPSEFLASARGLRSGLPVVAVNAKDVRVREKLRSWCVMGQTVALVGSSGVGKSTLVNTLSSANVQDTGTIRANDAKGRHTTTSRSLHLLPGGGLLLDSPGLRELQLSECETGVSRLFEEIETIAQGCRYSDCRHQGEIGCAVTDAVKRNELDDRRLENYLKLRREQEHATAALHEKRHREKSSGKSYRRAREQKRPERR